MTATGVGIENNNITESTSTPKMVPNPRAIPLSIACIVDVPNNTVCADKGIQYAFSKSNINAINIAIIIIAAYLNVFLNTIESNVKF
ncbi:Uncharacterised protein [Staphylococcus aureus]|nr:Uncharacterised protein [Staphylococcus aureus]SCU54754.1 Uncharacterised protein [Staphylococcus aureus]